MKLWAIADFQFYRRVKMDMNVADQGMNEANKELWRSIEASKMKDIQASQFKLDMALEARKRAVNHMDTLLAKKKPN